MSEEGNISHYPNAHIAWLGCLNYLLEKARREGLMSIECDVENPEKPNSAFQLFPQTVAHPYLDFATDVLRLIVGGNLTPEELQVYTDHYIAGLTAKNGLFSRAGADESLLRTIWLPLWASLKGNAPRVACEYGRQAIPQKIKPSFIELENTLRDINRRFRSHGQQNHEVGLDAMVDSFIASLG
jgi:chemotaxis protein MotA